jgi:hypothetical protein
MTATMSGDRGYLILLLLLCIPLGLFLAQIWARSRAPGVARLDQAAAKPELVPDSTMQPELQPNPEPVKPD